MFCFLFYLFSFDDVYSNFSLSLCESPFEVITNIIIQLLREDAKLTKEKILNNFSNGYRYRFNRFVNGDRIIPWQVFAHYGFASHVRNFQRKRLEQFVFYDVFFGERTRNDVSNSRVKREIFFYLKINNRSKILKRSPNFSTPFPTNSCLFKSKTQFLSFSKRLSSLPIPSNPSPPTRKLKPLIEEQQLDNSTS